MAASPVARPSPQSHTLNPEAEMWALYDVARREMLGDDAKGIATHTQPRLVGDTVHERRSQGTATTGVKSAAHVKPLATQPATADSKRVAKNNRWDVGVERRFWCQTTATPGCALFHLLARLDFPSCSHCPPFLFVVVSAWISKGCLPTSRAGARLIRGGGCSECKLLRRKARRRRRLSKKMGLKSMTSFYRH